jgi:hypothetical protein
MSDATAAQVTVLDLLGLLESYYAVQAGSGLHSPPAY